MDSVVPAPQCPRTGPYIINKIMATVCVVKDLLICPKNNNNKKHVFNKMQCSNGINFPELFQFAVP